ncbi:MAG: hypothetical protein KGD72_12440 [Candidatus Lokiarchaeota archaeon]|nr:hypothetical protein [Candidatus Lokiarchaeota archaeon]
MKSEIGASIKALLMAIVFFTVALFFIVSGLFDILSVTGGPIELLIIVPVIVVIIFIGLIVILVVVSIILKRRNILYKKVHNCRACGAAIKLEDHICNDCGKENTIRLEALIKIEDTERKIEEYQAKRLEKRKNSRKRMNRREKKIQETEDERLYKQTRELRLMKTKLITGNNRDGIMEWIKIQHYDLKRTIQDIADDSGESMLTVKNFLREIEDQEKQG